MMGCTGDGGGRGQNEGGKEVTRLRKERERNDAASTKYLSAVTLDSSASSGCRVSDAALLHNGPFPCRRKARTAAELFSSV